MAQRVLLALTDLHVLAAPPDTDLNAVIRKGSVLEDTHKRFIFYQLLQATRFLHSGHVIHRDQKVEPKLPPRGPSSHPGAPLALSALRPPVSPAIQRAAGCQLPGEALRLWPGSLLEQPARGA